MASDCFNRLEYVDLAMLYDLLDAGVCRAVDSAPTSSILGDYSHRSVVVSLAPTFHHVHQLDQTIGRGWHLLCHWPTSQLKYLDGLRRCLYTGHQLGQRDYFLVYPEDLLFFMSLKKKINKFSFQRDTWLNLQIFNQDIIFVATDRLWKTHPGFDVGVMIVTYVFYRENWTVLFGLTSFRPKRWVVGGTNWRNAKYDHRSALVVVYQRPEFAKTLCHRPLGDYVLARFRVALKNSCTLISLSFIN